MSRNERIALWSVLGVVATWLIVLSGIVAGELAGINRHLTLLVGGEEVAGTEETADPWSAPVGGMDREGETPPSWGASSAGASTGVGIAGVEVLTGSVSLTVTVRAYGAGDLLFEPPLLASEEGQTLPVTADSLEEARVAFLDLVTRGEATARLTFSGRLAPTAGLWLRFNPNQEPINAVAPAHSVPVPLTTGE